VPYPRIYRDCAGDARTEDGACSGETESEVRQDAEGFFLWVENEAGGSGIPKDTPLATLCRTGYRSVLAANILAAPEVYICNQKHDKGSTAHTACRDNYRGRGYRSVANIWHGFVGMPKAGIEIIEGNRYVVGDRAVRLPADRAATTRYGVAGRDLDLDRDGSVSVTDNDGWRYFQGLPFSRELAPARLYTPFLTPLNCYAQGNVAGCSSR
jgi:hypothetical protein